MSKNRFMPLKKLIGFMGFLASINSPLWSAAEVSAPPSEIPDMYLLFQRSMEEAKPSRLTLQNMYAYPIEVAIEERRNEEVGPGASKTITAEGEVEWGDSGVRVSKLKIRNYGRHPRIAEVSLKTYLTLSPGETSREFPFPAYVSGVGVRTHSGAGAPPLMDFEIDDDEARVMFNPALDPETLRGRGEEERAFLDLSELARKQVQRFLDGGYKDEDVDRAVEYIRSQGINMPLFLFSNHEDTFNFSVELLGWKNLSTEYNPKVNFYIDHINSFIFPNKKIKFLFYIEESYPKGKKVPESFNTVLSELFDYCPVLGFCTHPMISWSEKFILIPDPYIFGPGRKNIDWHLKKRSEKIQKRTPKIFFRGAASGYPLPYTIRTLKQHSRLYLMEMSKKLDFIDFRLSDDSAINWHGDEEVKDWYQTHHKPRGLESADFNRHAEFKYLISLDGFGAAWARVPLILSVGSVLLLQARCHQYFYTLMENGVTHIKISDDLENLEEVYTFLESHPDEAQKIAEAGRKFAKNYLAPSKQEFYLKCIVRFLSDSANRE